MASMTKPCLSGAGFAKGTGTSTKIGRPMGRGGHMPAEVSTPWLIIGVSHWEKGYAVLKC